MNSHRFTTPGPLTAWELEKLRQAERTHRRVYYGTAWFAAGRKRHFKSRAEWLADKESRP